MYLNSLQQLIGDLVADIVRLHAWHASMDGCSTLHSHADPISSIDSLNGNRSWSDPPHDVNGSDRYVRPRWDVRRWWESQKVAQLAYSIYNKHTKEEGHHHHMNWLRKGKVILQIPIKGHDTTRHDTTQHELPSIAEPNQPSYLVNGLCPILICVIPLHLSRKVIELKVHIVKHFECLTFSFI